MPEFGPANAVFGDENFGTNLPQTTTVNIDLDGEKKMAKFSKTKEYRALKSYMEARIQYYQKYLPDGRPVEAVPARDLAPMWTAANVIVGEFKAIMATYEDAAEVVKQAEARDVRSKDA